MAKIRCNLCFELGGKSFDFSKQSSQIWKSHAETHRLQVGDSGRSSLRYYSLCFPKKKQISRNTKVGEKTTVKAGRAESQPKVNDNARRELRTHCYALVKKCTMEKMECLECDAHMVIRCPEGYYRPERIYEHAGLHLQKKIFSCSYCKFQTTTKGSVKTHIRTKHAKPVLYVDRTAELKDEIMAGIDRCFGGQSRFGSTMPKPKLILQPSIKCSVMNTIRTRSAGRGNNPPAIYRHCVELANRFSKDGFISCRKCSNRVSVKLFDGGAKMVHHVTEVHLKKPLFLCGHCKKSFYVYQHVARHLKRVHSYGATGNYVDQRKKYALDIIDMLSRCFASGMTSKDKEKAQAPHSKGDTISEEAVKAMGTKSFGPSNDVEGGIRRFSCDRCDYATNYAKLIENHKTMMHA